MCRPRLAINRGSPVFAVILGPDAEEVAFWEVGGGHGTHSRIVPKSGAEY
jgi:hypothetical protein